MRHEQPRPRVTVVVVTWHRPELLRSCLASLARQAVPHRLVVVDNGSDHETAAVLESAPGNPTVLRPGRNLGFAGGVARAMEVVDTELVALVNNDAVVDAEWLAALVQALDRHPEAAAVTSLMVFADRPDVVNNAGVLLRPDCYGYDRGLGDPVSSWQQAGEVWGFSGGAALLRSQAVRDVGGFPAPFFLYYEDTDTSWRLRRAGWTVRYEPRAVVRHLHAASSDPTSELFAFHNERNRLLMLLRCAPLPLALRQTLRFCLTTASLTLRRAARRDVPDTATFRLGVRLRAVGSAIALAPWALRTRRVPTAASRNVQGAGPGVGAPPAPVRPHA